MTLRVLQFGATGQVAREMLARAKSHDAAVYALSRADVDFTDPGRFNVAIANAGGVDVVVNAAAYTAVDRAESDSETAFAVNAAAPKELARVCAAAGLPLIHISTDYVFSGVGHCAWKESDATAPTGVYGASKLAGEHAVLDAGGHALVLRTSWVFSAYGANFVKTMLRLGADRESISVVDDQHGKPTFAGDIAEALLAAAVRMSRGDKGVSGLLHFAGAEATTWCGFAREIFSHSTLP